MLRFLRIEIALMMVFVIGCNQQPPVANSQPAAKASKATKNSAPANSIAKKSAASHVTEKDGKKYLGDIPYDVWFDDPLAVVSNSASVASPDTVAKTDAGTAEPKPDTPMPDTKTPAAAGSDDWATYIALDQLQEETKRVRNALKPLLQTPVNYTKDFEQIKMHGTVLAALAVITAESGDGVSWKPNAGYIRDYGFQICDSAKGPGKPNYDATNTAFQNLESVFSGSIPPDTAEPDPARPASEVAPQYYVMKRMHLAKEALKLEINTEAKLKSQVEQALLEAMVLTALSKIVARPDYGSADEADYQRFIQLMIEKCQAATQAVQDQDFPKFQDAINVIDKTCNDCHVQYRG